MEGLGELLQQHNTRAQKDDLKVKALTQRIAQVVAQYEEQVAELRAEATVQIQALAAEKDDLQNKVNELESSLTELREADVAEEVEASDEG